MQPVQVTLFIVGTIIIIIAAYYVTYFIGVKSTGASRGRNRNINLLDRFSISKDKSFCLVEIAGKVYVVAVTNQSMTLLDTLDAATFAGTAAERGGASSWQTQGGQGGKYTARMTNRLASFLAARMGKPDPTGAGPTDSAGARSAGKPDPTGAGQTDSAGTRSAGKPDPADHSGSGKPDPVSPRDAGKPDPAGAKEEKPNASFKDSMREAEEKDQDE